MRRQPIVKSLAVVAALSACAVAAPTALAHTDVPPPDTSKAVVVKQQQLPQSRGYNVPRPDTSKAVVIKQQYSNSSSNDLRSPDARDAARTVVVTTGQDLRSPDASDAGRVVVVSNGQDLRSPDASDAARPSSTPLPSPTPDNGTDWGEIGMITGAVVLALGGAGAVFYITRRRGQLRKSGATVASS
jgi:hypothetical protein